MHRAHSWAGLEVSVRSWTLRPSRPLRKPDSRRGYRHPIAKGRDSLYPHAPEPFMARNEPPMSRIELLQGTLDLIVLQTLRWGPRHGYGIAQLIRAGSRDVLQVDAGSLYPALHRLERQGAVAADWGVSNNKQRVRIYRLTAAGRKQLAAERSKWELLTDAIAGIMVPPADSEA